MERKKKEKKTGEKKVFIPVGQAEISLFGNEVIAVFNLR